MQSLMSRVHVVKDFFNHSIAHPPRATTPEYRSDAMCLQAWRTHDGIPICPYSYSTWNIESKCYNRGAIDGCSQTNIRYPTGKTTHACWREVVKGYIETSGIDLLREGKSLEWAGVCPLSFICPIRLIKR
jgi:hypothetical protein